MRWRRLDVPGSEEARAFRTANGWDLSGKLHVNESGVIAQLEYGIHCDGSWRTRSALIVGEASGQ
ncbi:MAG TPA: putative glycolipid-binding domain-containing protein, partial [Gemmatimonadaceae bacterium]|nr:putative glycolipid-binding domain-containing protein [Gemmatimonadaceae bacterium]